MVSSAVMEEGKKNRQLARFFLLPHSDSSEVQLTVGMDKTAGLYPFSLAYGRMKEI